MSENHRLPSEELAAFVAGYPYESIPQSVLRENRRRILDTLGVAIGAREARPVEILLELTHELGGNPQAGACGWPAGPPIGVSVRGRRSPSTARRAPHYNCD